MNKKNIKYKPFNKFIFRTPTLPFESINDFVNKSDVRNEELKDFFDNDAIKEAIFLASPSLYEELVKFSEEKITDPNYIQDLKISLAKYLLRMATRCTPFGLFAGFSLGKFGDETNIKLDTISEHRSHTRFDMNYLVALSQDLLKNNTIRNAIKYYPNTSIHAVDDKIRYVEYQYKKSERIHNIVSVDFSEYLNKILKTAKRGSTISELGQIIVDEEIEQKIAENFVNELIDNQLLISEIEPAITGQEYIHHLLDKIKNFDGIDNILKVLKRAELSLKKIDKSQLGGSVNKYLPISEKIKELKTEFKINYLFQTDLYKHTKSNILSQKIADEILDGIEFLSKLTFEHTETNLTKFIERFEKRYGEKEICILEALDPEFGIGFLHNSGGDNSPLLEKIPIGYSSQANDKIFWNEYVSYLNGKILEAVANNHDIIELTDEETKYFGSKLDKLPPTFSVVCKIFTLGKNKEKQIYISSTGGSSAANLPSRFCHADKETNKFVKSIKDREEEILEDSIVAEIVHLPQARVGNVLLHPQFHNYEIPYLARSNSDIDHQIQLDDIMLSVQRNKLLLRSKKLNKIIIPRLSNAHNFSFNSQPIYHFLCEMQFQNNLHTVALPLGNALDRYEYIPRIVYKNLILHLAEWKVKKKEIEEIIKIKDENDLLDKITKWRISRKIPKLILLKEGDNTLFINLENIFSIKVFFAAIKGSEFTISEFIFDPENAVVTSEEGSFTNEFIISYYKTSQEVINDQN